MPSHRPVPSPSWPFRSLALLSCIGLFTLILAGCGGTGERGDTESVPEPTYDFKSTATFPIPPEIHPNVDFWRHVYGIWSRNQAAIHDNRYMDIIHEVARLPSGDNAAAREALVEARVAWHADRLRELERKVANREPLTEEERRLAARFERAGGPDALRGAAERVRSQRGLREQFQRGLATSGRYDAVFREIMRRNGVPEDLAYLPHVESSFQTNARSKVGAGGVWQFMPETGRTLMTVNDAIDERFDPILASEGAARYLASAHRRLQSWPLAITSYNHGQGGMAAAKAQYGDNIGRIVKNYQGPGFGFASRNFYSEFLAAREVASHPERYFPEGIAFEKPWSHDRLVLQHRIPVTQLAQHYGVSATSLTALNLHWNDRVRDGRTPVPPSSTVWLPAGTLRRVTSQPSPFQVVRVETNREKAPIAAAAPVRAPAGKAILPPSAGRTTVAATTTAGPGRVAIPGKVITTPPPSARATGKPSAATAANTKVTPPSKPSKPSKSPATVAVTPPKPAAGAKTATAPRYHVVKPQETLYRVAVQNGLTVDELRRLNRIPPGSNQVQPGQKLKVGG